MNLQLLSSVPDSQLPLRKISSPGLPSTLIQRHRLYQRMRALLDEHEVIGVFAAAGSGKSTLIKSFLSADTLPFAWLTIDSGDVTASRLASCLALAIDASDGGQARTALHDALASGATITEAGALLARHVPARHFTVVLDNCEMIQRSQASARLLSSFLDYLPPDARVILSSRQEPELSVGRMRLQRRLGCLTDEDLAFSLEEVRSFLAAQGRSDPDPRAAFDATGGWAAGLVFHADNLRRASGSDTAGLRDFFDQEVLRRLPANERDFLIDTSILDAVTASNAEVMCGPEGPALWRAIASRHLPATTTLNRETTYHPCFREYLQELLLGTDPDHIALIRRRKACALMEAGQFEDAVEEFICAGDHDQAATAAVRALSTLYLRADWQLLLRWFDKLGDIRIAEEPALQAARVRALAGSARMNEARQYIGQLDNEGRLGLLAKVDPGVVAYLAWAFQSRPNESLNLIETYGGDYRAEGLRYHFRVLTRAEYTPVPPQRDWHDAERHVAWGLFIQGRLDDLLGLLPSTEEWPRPYYSNPHPLLGLVFRGDVAGARKMFDIAQRERVQEIHRPAWSHVESWILWAEGQSEAALAAAERAVDLGRYIHSGWGSCFRIASARALLSMDQPAEAEAILVEYLRTARESSHRGYVEWAEALLGLARLQQGGTATTMLRECAQSMDRSQRLLFRPLVGVYLAEAEWRLGHADASFAQIDRAMAVSRELKTLFPLQHALADLPSVLERQLHRQPVQEEWRSVTLLGQHFDDPGAAAATGDYMKVNMHSLGADQGISVNGHPVRVRRLKAVELVALLCLRGGAIKKDELCKLLMPDSDREHASNHYRQLLHVLRNEGIPIVRRDDGMITFAPEVEVSSDDARLEAQLHAASSLIGTERLTKTLAALDIVSGDYLTASDLEWADLRRMELRLLINHARIDAARCAVDLRQHRLGTELCDSVLEEDPYAEEAYRVLMRNEAARGSVDGSLRVYRRMLSALESIGVQPDSASQNLLRSIRQA